jgi:hypothetical protein
MHRGMVHCLLRIVKKFVPTTVREGVQPLLTIVSNFLVIFWISQVFAPDLLKR